MRHAAEREGKANGTNAVISRTGKGGEERGNNHEIEPYLPIESSHERVRRTNVAGICAPGRANGRPLDRRKGRVVRDAIDHSRIFRFKPVVVYPLVSSLARGPPPQPGNPRSRVHLIIIAAGAGGARCPLNRSSTTSAPPPRNYESLRAGFHRGEHTRALVHAGPRQVLHAKVRGVIYGRSRAAESSGPSGWVTMMSRRRRARMTEEIERSPRDPSIDRPRRLAKARPLKAASASVTRRRKRCQ